MGDFNNSDFAYPVEMRDVRNRYVSTTTGLQTLAVEGAAQRWELDVNLKPTLDPGMVLAHQAAHGARATFDVEVPQFVKTLPSEAVALTTLAVAAAGATSLMVVRAARQPNQTLLAGLFFTIAGSPKVHMVTEDALINSPSVAVEVKIHPALRVEAAAGAVIDIAPEMRVRWAQSQGFSVALRTIAGVLPAYFVEAV